MLSRSLVARRPETLPATAPVGKMPAVIIEGIKDLMVSFASQAQGDGDTLRLLRVYGVAVTQFHPTVVAHALNWLKFHNPRNPFRPWPQDVFEQCQKTSAEWGRHVVDYFTYSYEWQGWPSYLGSPPLQKDCLLPDVWVKDHITRYLESYLESRDQRLRLLSHARLRSIPRECFLPGQFERASAAIDEREREAIVTAEREAKAASRQAYLASLDPELREWVREVLQFNSRGDETRLTEKQVIEFACERWAESNARKSYGSPIRWSCAPDSVRNELIAAARRSIDEQLGRSTELHGGAG
jgi:hypothetical protein